MSDSSLVGVGPLARLVVLSGLPASGKTTLYRRLFAATHEHVSKDHWPNARRRERRQRELVARHLREGRSVVVDNTNPTAAERAPLAAIAREMGLPAASFSLRVDLAKAFARNAARQGRARVPYVALASVARRLTTPSTDEGFDQLYEARLVDGLFVVVDVLRSP